MRVLRETNLSYDLVHLYLLCHLATTEENYDSRENKKEKKKIKKITQRDRSV